MKARRVQQSHNGYHSCVPTRSTAHHGCATFCIMIISKYQRFSNTCCKTKKYQAVFLTIPYISFFFAFVITNSIYSEVNVLVFVLFCVAKPLLILREYVELSISFLLKNQFLLLK